MSHPKQRSDLVVVIGASSLDVVGKLISPLQLGTSNPSNIQISFGGAARNVAENLARLGQMVTLLSVIGKDQVGDEVLAYTSQAGVDVSNVYRTDRFATGFYIGLLGMDGRREIAFDDMDVLEELNEAYLEYNEDLISKAGLIFLDANLSPNSLAKIFKIAREHKVPVCADPTSGVLAPNLAPYLKQISIIVPNGFEAGILLGTGLDQTNIDATMEAARKLVNRGVSQVFISIGDLGLCYASSETSGHFPSIKTNVIDPTGAGDALTAAVIFAFMNDLDLDDAAKLGVSAATVTLRHQGTVYPGMTLECLYDALSN